jgi:sulfur carrier protein
MTLLINGNPQQFESPLTLGQLLNTLQMGGKRIAVEKNGEIVPRSLHETTHLVDGDALEIVVAVGGG